MTKKTSQMMRGQMITSTESNEYKYRTGRRHEGIQRACKLAYIACYGIIRLTFPALLALAEPSISLIASGLDLMFDW